MDIQAGTAVTGLHGGIGIVTEPVKKSGIHKGKVSVMWVGGSYEVVADPENLTPVEVAII